MPKPDKIVETIDNVIEHMNNGFHLRSPVGTPKYAYLVKTQIVKDKDLIYVPIELVDEMFEKDLLYSSSMTSWYNYYRLKGEMIKNEDNNRLQKC